MANLLSNFLWLETTPPSPRPKLTLIKVFINNPFGATQEISCSRSDTVFELKQIAAKFLGMKPEAALLKRRGQPPMRDLLTLADYEVKDGSSLDLVAVYKK
ncbi:MAG: hypothetical protein LQ352_003247 [Teloschistes flavicans]|nr:MAG: hypothetical protein LQ352_003247 [Teloschistes flavicans]